MTWRSGGGEDGGDVEEESCGTDGDVAVEI